MKRALIAAVLAVLVVARRRGGQGERRRHGRRARSRARAVVANLRDSTLMDRSTGAVRSAQAADMTLPEETLDELWSARNLERLARTYWRFLTRATIGLIRVHYSDTGRSIVLLFAPLKLLTFHVPEYEMEPTRGLVRWRIARGVLVAKRGRDGGGYLQIEVRRRPGEDPAHAHLHVEVEVANFYPAIAFGLGRWVYEVTQSRIHVILTNGFLRSLARLDMAPSRVGRFEP